MPQVKYDNYNICKRCGGVNNCDVVDRIEYIEIEVETVCKDCGFEDYWARGWFMSSSEPPDDTY